jgi:hypothetical protein
MNALTRPADMALIEQIVSSAENVLGSLYNALRETPLHILVLGFLCLIPSSLLCVCIA